MINPSYNGIIKIGKTTREPEERAKELSSATGVATPFIVVYQRLFKNCHLAETLIHNYLSDKGYRVNNSREFFSIPTYEAIDLIANLSDEDNNTYTDRQDSEGEDLKDTYFNTALDYELGRNYTFIDFERAIESYKKAAQLGHIEAYHRIGHIYEEYLNNPNNAIKYYKLSAEKGYFLSYVRLGIIYMTTRQYLNAKNQYIAWNSFIRSIKDIDDKTKDLLYPQIIHGLYELILNYHLYHKSIPDEWSNIISTHKTSLLEYAKKMLLKKRVEFNNKYKDYVGESAEYMHDYRLIQLRLNIIHYYIKNL